MSERKYHHSPSSERERGPAASSTATSSGPQLDRRQCQAEQRKVNDGALKQVLKGEKTLGLGDRDPAVVEVKRLLNLHRGSREQLPLTDTFDKRTEIALKAFQRTHALSKGFDLHTVEKGSKSGLTDDGMVGPATASALLAGAGHKLSFFERVQTRHNLNRRDDWGVWAEQQQKQQSTSPSPEATQRTSRTSTRVENRVAGPYGSFTVNQAVNACGPASVAAATAIATGKNVHELNRKFTERYQRSGADSMSWASPEKWGESEGARVKQLDVVLGQSFERKQRFVDSVIDQVRGGNVVVASVGKPVAQGRGHIVTIVDAYEKNGKSYVVSLDPNPENRPGRNVMEADFFASVVKTGWSFEVPPARLVELGRVNSRTRLASR